MSFKSDWYVVDYRSGEPVDNVPHSSQPEAARAAKAFSLQHPSRVVAVRNITH